MTEYYTANDLQRKFKISRNTIYYWITNNNFPSPKKFGRSSRWNMEEVENWESNQELQANSNCGQFCGQKQNSPSKPLY